MNWKFEKGRIYSVDENGELLAEATFAVCDGVANIDHTFVNPSLRGQGVAGKMMKAVVEHLKDNNLKVSATCSYANSWLKKNRELYSGVISDKIDEIDASCKIDSKR